MKRSERGFTLIELIVAAAIIVLIVGAATMTTFQVLNVTRSSNDHMTAIRQVQNAGYWISRDALMAQKIDIGDDPDTTEITEVLILSWTEWGYDEDSTYHSVTYSIQDLSDGFEKLVRTHWSSDGVDEETLIAKYIYYTGDPEDDATWAYYDYPVLTMQIVASLGDANEIREYEIWHRRDF